jgi:hypothetical protein
MIKRFDGVELGAPSLGDGLFRTFDPPWWHLRRWAGWYASIFKERFGRQIPSARARGTITVSHDGKSRSVRVVAIDRLLPNVPGPNVVEISGGPPRGYYR